MTFMQSLLRLDQPPAKHCQKVQSVRMCTEIGTFETAHSMPEAAADDNLISVKILDSKSKISIRRRAGQMVLNLHFLFTAPQTLTYIFVHMAPQK